MLISFPTFSQQPNKRRRSYTNSDPYIYLTNLFSSQTYLAQKTQRAKNYLQSTKSTQQIWSRLATQKNPKTKRKKKERKKERKRLGTHETNGWTKAQKEKRITEHQTSPTKSQ